MIAEVTPETMRFTLPVLHRYRPIKSDINSSDYAFPYRMCCTMQAMDVIELQQQITVAEGGRQPVARLPTICALKAKVEH